MKQIALTQGKFALVDDEDFEYLSQWKWCAHYQGNRQGNQFNVVRTDKNGKTVLMHRVIMKPPVDTMIDHIDRNPLNNQKSNLRFADYSKNAGNREKYRTNKSGYKGVYWDKNRNKWKVGITMKNKHVGLGRYDTIEEAALAYNRAALEHFGEYALLNDIKEINNVVV